MYVGMVKLSLVIDQSHSLKEKRMVLRRIKDRVRDRAHVHLSKVGSQDVWQRAELGCAVASSDRTKALEVLDEVVRVAMSAGGAQIVGVAKDVTTFSLRGERGAWRYRATVPAGPGRFAAAPYFDAESVPFSPMPIDDRTGTGDKAQAQDDFIPAEWRDQAERE